MLTALPTLIPSDVGVFPPKRYDTDSPPQAYSPRYHFVGTYSGSSSDPTPNPLPQHARNAPARAQANPPSRTFLSVLRADENAYEVRKANIRRFGADWLKPPGIGKTLQGLRDERAEREEQEAAQAREQALADAQAAAAAEADAEARTAAGFLAEEEEVSDTEEPRNLDDDIPDADDGQWIDETEDAMPSDEGDGDYAEDVEVVPANAAAGVEERDLDEDVPEAGSYQHTDTDVEEASSEEDLDEEMVEEVHEMPGRSVMPGNITARVYGTSPALDSSPVSPSARSPRSARLMRRMAGREN